MGFESHKGHHQSPVSNAKDKNKCSHNCFSPICLYCMDMDHFFTSYFSAVVGCRSIGRDV